MDHPILSTVTFGQAILLLALISVRLARPIEMSLSNTVSIDQSCPSVHMDACLRSSNDSCSSLQEALAQHYNTETGQRLTSDTPYHVFSVFDLFYSGLVQGESSPPATSMDLELESVEAVDSARRRCEALRRKLKFSKKDSDNCQWEYTCKYNPHYFPSFTVEARLNDALSDWNACEAVRVRNLKFVRTECLTDPNNSHWCPCNAGYVTTGYDYHSYY